MKKNTKFYFLVRSWNSFSYLKKCLTSILQQNRDDYTILFVDDASDYTKAEKHVIKSLLKRHITIFNDNRNYSLRNAHEMIHKYVENDEAIILNVDGDDWLIRNDVVEIVEEVYESTNCFFTYGNCIYHNPGQINHLKVATDCNNTVNRKYPFSVEHVRREYFRPLHLRTWKTSLFKKIKKESFLRPDGSWIKFCEDQAMFLPFFELCSKRYEVIDIPLVAYNQENSLNDNKIHFEERLFDEVCILKKLPYSPIK